MWLSVGLGCEGVQERGKCEDAEYISWYFGETGLVYKSSLHNPIKRRLKGPQKFPFPLLSGKAGKCWQTGVRCCGVKWCNPCHPADGFLSAENPDNPSRRWHWCYWVLRKGISAGFRCAFGQHSFITFIQRRLYGSSVTCRMGQQALYVWFFLSRISWFLKF